MPRENCASSHPREAPRLLPRPTQWQVNYSRNGMESQAHLSLTPAFQSDVRHLSVNVVTICQRPERDVWMRLRTPGENWRGRCRMPGKHQQDTHQRLAQEEDH